MTTSRALHAPNDAPWILRFRAPTVLWTMLAKAEPTRGLAASNQSGLYQLYAWDVRTGQLRQLTDKPQGVVFGSISPDGRHVYYFDDEAGNEIGHWVRITYEGGTPQSIAPNLAPYSTVFLGFSQDGRMLGFTAATSDGFEMIVVELGPAGELGVPRQLYQTGKLASGPILSHDADVAIVATTERSGTLDTNLLAFDVASGQQIGELWDKDASVTPVLFAPRMGDTRLLATTNRSGDKHPVVWDPRSGERTDLALSELEGEVLALDWSPDGKRVLLSGITQAVPQLYTYDFDNRTLNCLDHPRGTFVLFNGVGTYFASEDEIFAQWENSENPPRLVALDSHTGGVTRTILAASNPPPSRPRRSITFTSSDGQAIQGWLIVPDGKEPFPTVLETHGGPTAVDTDAYSASAMTWVDHGFAYCSINYRGSTTFGKRFQDQILRDLGHWEVEDMVAARNWLVANQIANPSQILLTGWSYGGYLTLLGLGKYPDLWAGGMAGIAIADWRLMYEDQAPTLRGYQVSLFGGTPQEKPEQHAISSPITYAENVRAPVLIIQGRNDTRTPARQVEVYEERMKSLGKEIEVHWFETGHLGAFADNELAIDHHRRMLAFASRVLNRSWL
jgi:dipeptidyl aminopeptidase/acylaminoacyl peptidase